MTSWLTQELFNISSYVLLEWARKKAIMFYIQSEQSAKYPPRFSCHILVTFMPNLLNAIFVVVYSRHFLPWSHLYNIIKSNSIHSIQEWQLLLLSIQYTSVIYAPLLFKKTFIGMNNFYWKRNYQIACMINLLLFKNSKFHINGILSTFDMFPPTK